MELVIDDTSPPVKVRRASFLSDLCLATHRRPLCDVEYILPPRLEDPGKRSSSGLRATFIGFVKSRYLMYSRNRKTVKKITMLAFHAKSLRLKTRKSLEQPLDFMPAV